MYADRALLTRLGIQIIEEEAWDCGPSSFVFGTKFLRWIDAKIITSHPVLCLSISYATRIENSFGPEHVYMNTLRKRERVERSAVFEDLLERGEERYFPCTERWGNLGDAPRGCATLYRY
jgi:hypothetical protein